MNKLLLILFMILLLMNNYCNKETKKDEFSVDKPYYYGHQNKYTIPNTHSKPLTIEEAKNKTVYYKVYYNNKNQVFKTIRYYSNSIDFKKIYHYRNNGTLQERIYISNSNDTAIQKFDEEGQLIIENNE